ncbi:hypothetical protein ACOKM5_06335 [Streptomyces sp. BH097]|uniref:hypothetical protein n=1 Tax=unclassified Streptomyces TaxID=2593676 RepID=UPI003BB6749E
MTRTLSASGVAVALTLLAAGCSPPQLALVAIGKGADRDVRALLRPCADDDRYRVSVTAALKDEPTDTAVLDGWGTRPSASITGEQEISLFRPPRSWIDTPGSATQLAPGVDYFVHFFVGHGDTVRYSGFTAFERADLKRLSPGQWLVDGKTMTRAEFETHVDDVC